MQLNQQPQNRDSSARLPATVGLVGGANPAHAAGRDDHQPVLEVRRGAARQQRQQQRGDVVHGGRMSLDADYAVVLGQRQYGPVTKVLVQGDEHALVAHGTFENLCVIGSALAHFRGADDIMAAGAQLVGEFRPKHLVEIEAHDGSDRFEDAEFGVEDGLAGVVQHRLNVGARQLRVTVQERIPRFAGRELFQEGGHRNACAFDDGLSATDAGRDFNALVHATEDTGIERLTQGRVLNGEAASSAPVSDRAACPTVRFAAVEGGVSRTRLPVVPGDLRSKLSARSETGAQRAILTSFGSAIHENNRFVVKTVVFLGNSMLADGISIESKGISIETDTIFIETEGVFIGANAISIETEGISIETVGISIGTDAIFIESVAVFIETVAISIGTVGIFMGAETEFRVTDCLPPLRNGAFAFGVC